MSLSSIFDAPLQDDTSKWGQPAQKKTPWSDYRSGIIGVRDIFWNAVGDDKRRAEVFGAKKVEERKVYADFLSERMKTINTVREEAQNSWGRSYKGVAKEAFDGIPAAILLDFARSNLSDEDIKTKIHAFVGYRVKATAKERYDALSDGQKARADAYARGTTVANLTTIGQQEALPSEEEMRRAGDLEQRFRSGLKPKRDLPEVETAQLAMMFGFSLDSLASDIGKAEKVVQDFVDEKILKTLTAISEAPARALDWLAQQATGDDEITAGQALFGKGNAASGAVDAAKVFFLDTFVLFGKASKLAKVGQGVDRIGNLKNIDRNVAMLERGLDSAPVQRFAKWWTKQPDELRTIGFGDRNSEMFGWNMKSEVWQRLRDTRSVDEVKSVLREESLAGNIEALPYLRPTHVLRRAAEMRRVGPVKINNPMTGMFRTTWGSKLDPNSPIFSKSLRRFGDYMFGVENPTDLTARVVDGHVSRISTYGIPKADRTKLMGQFVDDGLQAFATRHGATPEQAAEALQRAKDLYPGFAGRARQTAYGINDGGVPISAPFRQTQIANAVPVPSYLDILAYQTELRDVMGKALTGRKLRAFDEQVHKGTRLVIRSWLAKPSTLMRAGVEETFDLAGHPVFGKEYRRVLGEQMLDSAAHLLHRGHPLRPPKMAEAAGDMRRELLAHNQYRGHMGMASQSITGEVAEELAKAADEIDIDLFHWKPVDPDDVTFTHAWYHVVNHQVLQDPLSAIIVTYGDDLDVARNMGRMWLETPEGQRYLRQLPTPQGVEVANKAESILDLHIGDIDRNIPQELMPLAQGALASGGKVSFADLEAAKQLGRHPNRVVGPVPVSQLPAAEAEKLGYFQQTKVGEIAQKPYNWGATWVDYLSRRPGFAAAKKHRAKELGRLNEMRAKYGAPKLGEDFIEKESSHYANREMWRMDNPLERSRSDFWLRNISPFQYNQNNFMKRWGRKLATNPGYVSRLRMFVGAMEDMGFVQKDENGNLTFQIPISAEFYSNLLKRQKDAPKEYRRLALSLGFGSQPSGAGVFKSAPFEAFGKLALPPGMPFAAAVDPGFGPMLTMPVAWITANKPKLDWLRGAILGGFEDWDPNQGFLHNMADGVGASWFADISKAFSGTSGDRAYVGAVRDLAAYAEFTGKDIFDPKVQKQLEGDAKFFFIVRGLTKFAFPYAAASPVFMEQRDELQTMLDELGPEEGTLKFLEKYDGKGWAMLTSLTEAAEDWKNNQGRKPKVLLPPTAHAEAFYRDNAEFFEAFPNVAGIFANRKGDRFDPTAFRRQLQRGQRVGRNMQQFWLEMNIEAGAHEYFENLMPLMDKARAAGMSDEQVSAGKRAVVAQLNQTFPGFKDFLDGWSSRRALVEESREELRQAVKDPKVAKRKDVEPLATFLSYYDRADAQAKAMGYVRLGQQKGTRGLRAGMVAVYKHLMETTDSAVLERAYTFLFRADLEDEETDG